MHIDTHQLSGQKQFQESIRASAKDWHMFGLKMSHLKLFCLVNFRRTLMCSSYLRRVFFVCCSLNKELLMSQIFGDLHNKHYCYIIF